MDQDIERLVEDFNYIREVTGVSEDMVLQLIYQLNQIRELKYRKPAELVNWPSTN